MKKNCVGKKKKDIKSEIKKKNDINISEINLQMVGGDIFIYLFICDEQ